MQGSAIMNEEKKVGQEPVVDEAKEQSKTEKKVKKSLFTFLVLQ